MAYEIATLLKNGGDDCHYQFIEAVRVLAEANGWTTLRSVTTGDDREWIGQSTDNVFVGLKTYQDSVTDYYNLKCGTFVGFLTENTFENQPGARIDGCPAHNNAITYFLVVNARRIYCCLKVGTPVYTHFHMGRFLAYNRPEEYPLPIANAGCFNGTPGTRFSNNTYEWPFHEGHETDSYFRYRRTDGAWATCFLYPYTNTSANTINVLMNSYIASTNYLFNVPADADGTYYHLEPIVIFTSNDVVGEIEGVYAITGFNNNVENVLQDGGSSEIDQTGLTVDQAVTQIKAVGGKAFVVLQNINRTDFNDFIALEMD